MYKRVIFFIFPLFLFYVLPVNAIEKEERTLADEVVYDIVIDRFFDGNLANNRGVDVNNPQTFNGGDFAGITKKLDYLKGMGFTTIILSPIFLNEQDGYHGYWIRDFYNTDPHFGTLAEFKKLVVEAHKREIKVMIDFVANDVGPNHSWLSDPTKQDWFHEKNVVVEGELDKAWINGRPDLNQENPEMKAYLLAVAKWWLVEMDIDGYRLNRMQYVGLDYWRDFVQAVTSEKEDVYLIGDFSGANMKTVAKYEKLDIDAFMDDKQNEELRKAFAAPDRAVTAIFANHTNSKSLKQVQFMDTNQSSRFTLDAVAANQHPGTRWKIALSFLYTTSGVPMLLYGSEIALNGDRSQNHHPFMNFKTDKDVIDYITKLAEIRAAYPALSQGDMNVLFDEGGVVVYKRTWAEETIIIVMNNTSKTQRISLTRSDVEQNKELRGLLNGDLVRSKEDMYSIVIDREQTEIYKLATKSMINIPYFTVLFMVLAIFVLFIRLVIKRSK